MNQEKIKRFALIVAGGKGVRMGNVIPKQFLLLSGKPLLMHTMRAFYDENPEIELILVLPKTEQSYWQELCLKYDFLLKYRLVDGGETRFESVKNGLDLIHEDGLVAIHDGVRPFVDAALIERCFKAADVSGAAVPVTELTESIRKLEGETSFSVHRQTFRSVQTPQTFRVSILKEAYMQPYKEHFTDDASVVEALGYAVELVEGSIENIKITNTLDLLLAEQMMKSNPRS